MSLVIMKEKGLIAFDRGGRGSGELQRISCCALVMFLARVLA